MLSDKNFDKSDNDIFLCVLICLLFCLGKDKGPDGALIGGVTGGIFLFIIIVIVCIVFAKKRRNSSEGLFWLPLFSIRYFGPSS